MNVQDYIIAKTAPVINGFVESWYAKLADLFDRGIICKHGAMSDEDCYDCIAEQSDLAYIRKEIEHIIALQELGEIWA